MDYRCIGAEKELWPPSIGPGEPALNGPLQERPRLLFMTMTLRGVYGICHVPSWSSKCAWITTIVGCYPSSSYRGLNVRSLVCFHARQSCLTRATPRLVLYFVFAFNYICFFRAWYFRVFSESISSSLGVHHPFQSKTDRIGNHWSIFCYIQPT